MDLHSAISPIFIICKILAITPYSVQKSLHSYKLVVTKQDLIICIVEYICLAGYYIYAMIFYNVVMLYGENIIDMLTKITQHIAIIMLGISSLTFFHIHKKEIFYILTSLTDIAQELKRMNIIVEYRIVRRFCLIHTGLRLFLFATVFTLHVLSLTEGMTVAVMILYNIVVNITSMNPGYVFALLFAIKYKYSLINTKLRYMFCNQRNRTSNHIQLSRITVIGVSNASEENKIAVLKNLIYIHGRLYSLCQTINSMYNVHFVIILLSCFIATVESGYEIISYIDDDKFTFIFFLSMSNWAIYNIAQVILIVQNLQACCTQANQTATILNDIRYNKCNSEINERRMTFVMLLTHQKLKFTAYGLFTLDYTFLYTMTGAVSTYLIILYQFRNAI